MVSQGWGLYSVEGFGLITVWTVKTLNVVLLYIRLCCVAPHVQKNQCIACRYLHIGSTCAFLTWLAAWMALAESVIIYGFVPFLSRPDCGFTQDVTLISIALNEIGYICWFWLSLSTICATLLQGVFLLSENCLSLHLSYTWLCENLDIARNSGSDHSISLHYWNWRGWLFVMHLTNEFGFPPSKLVVAFNIHDL